ncbi:MAG: hypothetical protein NTY32_12640 [Bacteroidia bacterium]|nr:hypothetical protein [Bacteroidia bacterium]
MANICLLDEILAHKVSIPVLEHPLQFFEKFLNKGYYPFALEEDYDLKMW